MGDRKQELGFLEGFNAGQSGRFYRPASPGKSMKSVEWIVKSNGSSGEATIHAASERAGTVKAIVTLTPAAGTQWHG
jgi:hypothetical protein